MKLGGGAGGIGTGRAIQAIFFNLFFFLPPLLLSSALLLQIITRDSGKPGTGGCGWKEREPNRGKWTEILFATREKESRCSQPYLKRPFLCEKQSLSKHD